MIIKIKKGVLNIAKTDITKTLERQIWKATAKQGVFGCFEVTIGWWGKQRVDYLTFDTKEVWRCYEIKSSKSDFRSGAKHTFVGNYNYYVMPMELYQELKDSIPPHIGVYVGGECVKRAKRQDLEVDVQTLKNSMIRSLCREAQKVYKSNDPTTVERLNRQIRSLQREKENYQRNYWNLMRIGQEKYGTRWHKE